MTYQQGLKRRPGSGPYPWDLITLRPDDVEGESQRERPRETKRQQDGDPI